MPDFWSKRRVVVTGGRGFLGSYVVEKLERRGAKAVLVPTHQAYDLRLEEAVRKMTSFAAAAAGFQDRGILRAGLAADLVAFDPVTIRSEATFETPNRYSIGFRYVAVNGVLVVDDGKLTGKTPGQPLRGPGYRQRVGAIPTPKK